MQRSLDELDTPLSQVTFCVLDLETTGLSPAADTITEVGAVKVRGGECLGTFQTLVNPGVPVPEAVSRITGITGASVREAPSISQVLPSLDQFVGGAVLVGHNIRFDWAFLDSSLVATEREPLGLRRVDTAALARRLLADDVPDCKLATLARRFRFDRQPTHRALDDALATVELLHLLLERAAGYGVWALDDLLALPGLLTHPQADKLPLTNRLPRSAGGYVIRDGQGEPLYRGEAEDVRSRVRSYFAGEDQREIGRVLRVMQMVDYVP